jgi:hypothetical protein
LVANCASPRIVDPRKGESSRSIPKIGSLEINADSMLTPEGRNQNLHGRPTRRDHQIASPFKALKTKSMNIESRPAGRHRTDVPRHQEPHRGLNPSVLVHIDSRNGSRFVAQAVEI